MATSDFTSTAPHLHEASPLSRSDSGRIPGSRFEENFDARTRGSSVLGDGHIPSRSHSRASTLGQGTTPSRSGTLKKRASVKRSGSLKRSGSRRSVRAGSIAGVNLDNDHDHDDENAARHNSVFYTPVPTSGNPTEILANRFQAWRRWLKDLIAYFREVAASYEHRSKALLKVSNVINNTNAPSVFMTEGGLNDANRILRDYHKQALAEANKAKDIETEVVNQLSGLRADLGQKIKEIKSLSGDFKNSVEKEKENTRKAVAALEESLSLIDLDPAAVAGKGDPFVVRLGVDRQVERQIDEENYLHRAYLNLENSGRELESIVVGEIQKAYNALASIMKREADDNYSTIERLRSGPVGMPRDLEWNEFVMNDSNFVNPDLPLRRLEDIEYPGKHHPAAAEVRAGMLERKSKYLKSYTPGWYVLSPTHLHEFKSADRIYTQPPVMSLLLSDQKLGSHSQPGSSSHKFVIKGRQTGSMHRGHTWVFRAETYDTMLAWYDDINSLAGKTGDERNAFVARHKRSLSVNSRRSESSDGGLEEDEADQIPFSAAQSVTQQPVAQQSEIPSRPSPGGRFPSDLQVDRSLHPPGPSSGSSSEIGLDLGTASGGAPQQPGYVHYPNAYGERTPMDDAYGSANPYEYHPNVPVPVQQQTSYYAKNAPSTPLQPTAASAPQSTGDGPHEYYDDSYHQPNDIVPSAVQAQPPQRQPLPSFGQPRPDSNYAEWMAPVAAGVGGAAIGGSLASRAYQHNEQQMEKDQINDTLTHPMYPNPNMGDPYSNDNSSPVPATTVKPMSQHASTALVAPLPVPMPAQVTSEHTLRDTTEPHGLGSTSLGFAQPSSSVKPLAAGENGSINSGGGPPNSPPAPGVQRQNTDFSVSDLHVPGEYPKVAASVAESSTR